MTGVPSWCPECCSTDYERTERRLATGKLEVIVRCRECNRILKRWQEEHSTVHEPEAEPALVRQ